METRITQIFQRFLVIVERIRAIEADNDIAIFLFGAVMIFGILNCVLGYRLLRFWVMLFGFAVGAGIGYFGSNAAGILDHTLQLIICFGAGIILAIVAFLIYRAGIFLLGAGLGATLSIYLLHPTNSAVFFLCLLIGLVIGGLALHFSKEVLIIGTSLLGGSLAGLSLAKLLHLQEIPYGILMSLGIALVGVVIQFMINSGEEEEDDEDEEEEEPEDSDKKPEPVKEDELGPIDPTGQYDNDEIDEDGYRNGPDGSYYYYELEKDK